MTSFHEKNGILHVDDIPLDTLAEEFGTPSYIYAASSIKSQYEKLAQAMRKTLPEDRQPLFCYACKANSNIAVLSYLNTLGSGLEIVSAGELKRGLKAGFSPQKIVSTGVGKSEQEIAALLHAGVHQINVESLPELERIQTIATQIGKTAPVVFRYNPNISGGGHDKISTGRDHDKFGIDENKVFEGFAMAQNMSNVNALGLSMHVGSQVFDVHVFEKAFRKLPKLVSDLRKEGYTIDRLDIGGGFPIQYNDENLLDLESYAEWVRDIILPLETEIIMEPGRFLVGNAGILLTKVEYVKQAGNRNFLILDGAMNDLIRPTLYDAYHGIEPVKNRTAALLSYDVVGPICETGDTFSKDRLLPSMKQGDLAVIKSAGAYGSCMSSNYNTRPLAPEIFVDGNQYAVIRPRQTVEDILEREAIPEWI